MAVCVTGSIGSGKSTVVERLQASWDVGRVIPEPITDFPEWIEAYYDDQHRNALAFQLKVLKEYVTIDCTQRCVVERSPMDCLHVFVPLLKNDGKITPLEEDCFREYYDMLAWQPRAIIYLRASPETCMRRVRQRSRAGEDAISLEYLTKLHDLYEASLPGWGDNIHIVDADQDVDQVLHEVVQLLRRHATISPLRVNLASTPAFSPVVEDTDCLGSSSSTSGHDTSRSEDERTSSEDLSDVSLIEDGPGGSVGENDADDVGNTPIAHSKKSSRRARHSSSSSSSSSSSRNREQDTATASTPSGQSMLANIDAHINTSPIVTADNTHDKLMMLNKENLLPEDDSELKTPTSDTEAGREAEESSDTQPVTHGTP